MVAFDASLLVHHFVGNIAGYQLAALEDLPRECEEDEARKERGHDEDQEQDRDVGGDDTFYIDQDKEGREDQRSDYDAHDAFSDRSVVDISVRAAEEF